MPRTKRNRQPELVLASVMDVKDFKRKTRIKGTFAAAGEAQPEPSTSEPASTGQELAKQAEERFAVRHKRDGIDAAQHSTLLDDKPGRQTSKELAALAAKYINLEINDVLSNRKLEAMCADVRKLAASVLGQVNE